ncbi:MAG TPA: hypothetical protein VMJ72_02635, partial [Candidatus Paceibacterota bacterium]|nr:hypothetical protein [Candidatus Paceibacterota bacterium]
MGAQKLGRNWYITRSAFTEYLATRAKKNISSVLGLIGTTERPRPVPAQPIATVSAAPLQVPQQPTPIFITLPTSTPAAPAHEPRKNRIIVTIALVLLLLGAAALLGRVIMGAVHQFFQETVGFVQQMRSQQPVQNITVVQQQPSVAQNAPQRVTIVQQVPVFYPGGLSPVNPSYPQPPIVVSSPEPYPPGYVPGQSLASLDSVVANGNQTGRIAFFNGGLYGGNGSFQTVAANRDASFGSVDDQSDISFTVHSKGLALDTNGNADFGGTVSAQNADVVGYSSASSTFGSGLSNCAGAEFLQYSSSSGTFVCTSAAVAVVPAQGTLTYYFSSSSSDVATYLVQRTRPQDTTTTIVTPDLNTGTNMLANWITPSGTPNLTFVPAGQYEFHIHVAQLTGDQTVRVYAEVWETNASGSDVALLGTSEPSAPINNAETEYPLFFTTADVHTMASSASRIVTRVYALVSGSGAAPQVILYTGGEADSHISLPSNTVDASTFIPYTGATQDIDLGDHNLIAVDASLSSNLEVSGTASASQFFGSGLSSCPGGQQLHWNNGTFSCVTVTGSAGSAIDVNKQGGPFQPTASLSFGAGQFNVTYSAPESLVTLDWGSGGPVSRSLSNTFSAASNQFSNTLEVGTASVSDLNISGPLLGTDASLSGNLTVFGISSSSATYGSGLVACAGSADKLLWDAGSGHFMCGTDSGASGQTIAVGLTGGTFNSASSISFNSAHFAESLSVPEARISLNWGAGGPASRSLSNLFTAASNQFSHTLEIGTASVSALNIAGTPFVPSNYLPLTGGTLTGTL